MNSYRPTRLISHMSVIASNFRIVRAMAPGVRHIAVVKADAYGHGALPVARTLLREGAWGLAVATVEEAVLLREGGIASPILVLGATTEAGLREDVSRGVSQAVFDPKDLLILEDEAEKTGRDAIAHLKVDTGMSRIGVRTEKALTALLDVWKDCPHVRMEGVFTHYAKADTDPEFTALQKARFEAAVSVVSKYGFAPIRHAAASTGIALGAAHHFDAVRPGIVLYGAAVCGQFPGIEPAQTLLTRPVRIEWIDAGDTVGYGGTFRAAEPTRVMTLPIGYGDGYPRILSGKSCVLVEGRRVPVIGRVCMDQLMVDVTSVPQASLESEAVLLGRQGDQRITPDELAELAQTIPYEIMLSFSQRVLKEATD